MSEQQKKEEEKDLGAALLPADPSAAVTTEPLPNEAIERLRFLMPLFLTGTEVILFREVIPADPPVSMWIAACRDYYVVAQGRDADQAFRAWRATFLADALMFMALGCERGRTPDNHWAEMNAKTEETRRVAFTQFGSGNQDAK